MSLSSKQKRKERRREYRKELEDQTPYYLRVGIQEFHRTHTSAPEKVTLMLEKRSEAPNEL